MFAVVSLHQIYVESSFSGLFGAFNVLALAVIVLVASRLIRWGLVELGGRNVGQSSATSVEHGLHRP
jgi:hypothetical protein